MISSQIQRRPSILQAAKPKPIDGKKSNSGKNLLSARKAALCPSLKAASKRSG